MRHGRATGLGITLQDDGLLRRSQPKIAVRADARPGGFLGPNGAGKTTTMRMILGLDRPTAGSVTVNGQPFAGLYSAMREVGALLDAKAVHRGRSDATRPASSPPQGRRWPVPPCRSSWPIGSAGGVTLVRS
jgi:hypothetical protein